MSAVDIPEKLVTGKTRNRTFFQIAALAGTAAYVEGTFSAALAQSGSGTSTETTVTGLIADPNSASGSNLALTSNLDAVAGGSSGGSSGGPTCNAGETVSGGACADPKWGQVVLLSHFDGADGGGAFVDERRGAPTAY